jgi:hypothetical protein
MRSFAVFRIGLEGKKGNLEGTWRAVVGHLEGKPESPQSLIQSRSKGNLTQTWRVFEKSIYKGSDE